MNKIANNLLEKRNKEHYENLEVKWQDIYIETTPVKTR